MTNSVTANAASPIIAKRPFNISAEDENIALDLLCTVIPLNMGTNDATDNNPAVTKNHGTPPLLSWLAKSCPLASSTAIADTNPTIASLPLMVSGAGPENANTSRNLVLTFLLGTGVTGLLVGDCADEVEVEVEVEAVGMSFIGVASFGSEFACSALHLIRRLLSGALLT